jgi:hypothetical protein
MDSHALRHSPAAAALPRWLVVGFVSGFVAVLIFHQGAAAILHALQWTPRAPYPMEAVAPLGLPQVLSLAFWGGVWGVLLAAVLARFDDAKLVVAATIFGAILPTLIAWFVVAPLKGQPPAGGFVMPGLLVGPIVNAAWGFGTGLGLLWFRRHRTGSATQKP